MKINFIAVFLGMCVLASAFAGGSNESSQGSSAASYTIEVGGSTSVTPLMELFASAYRASNSHIQVNINGTGSGDGIRNAGVLYQIGMSSRELTAVEKGQGLRETIVALDGIAVIVNRNNPVRNLTIEQIRDIYTGAITDWSQVSGGAKTGRIAVISREEGSGTRGAFEEIIGFQGRLVRGANESTSTGAIKAGIAQNPDAIGYISLGSADNTISVLQVNGVAANVGNVQNGTYRIARPFIILTGANVRAETTAFINWMTGRDGQRIVSDNGWIPVR